MTDLDQIICTHDGPVSTVTINRPGKHNAFTGEMLQHATRVLRLLDERAETRVVVITGAGTRSFSAGADLTEMQAMSQFEVLLSNRIWIEFFRTIELIRKPVLASVRGHCLAGGTELTLACDIVIASADATFGLTEMQVGVIPGAGACARLTRWVGRGTAKAMLLLGEVIPAVEAHRIGLVHQVVENDQLVHETARLAARLAAKSPPALAAAKRAVNIGSEMDLDRGIEYVLQEFALLFGGPDQKEGMTAFLEKRQPQYSDSLHTQPKGASGDS